MDDADGATTGGSDRRAQFELWASGQLMTFKKLLSPINLLKLLVSLPKTHIRETANFRNLHQILCLLGPFFSEVVTSLAKYLLRASVLEAAWLGQVLKVLKFAKFLQNLCCIAIRLFV